MKDIKDALIDKQIIKDVLQNREYNNTVIDYYKQYSQSDEVNKNRARILTNRAESINDCNKFWVIDKYELQKIKDVKKQNLCRDKFCSNCKKVKQSARMARYIPELENYQDSLYHLTLTLPNCNGAELKDTVKVMSKAFRRLIYYIRCEKDIKGIDFQSWGYLGAVRSLEITFDGDNYHPHYHVGLVLDPRVISKKNIINTYSYDLRKSIPELTRLFSEQEILIQKIWYLLITGDKVTKENIDNLEIGYSCTIDKFQDGDYAELFKYMTKEKDMRGTLLSYDNFKTLYSALYRVKQIQGYGCLYRITDDIDLEEYEAKYEELIEKIRQKESPIESLERPKELLLDTQYKIISRKTYFKYLRSL